MASGIDAAEVLPVVSISRAISTLSGSFSCFANSSMMRILAWWGTNAANSLAETPDSSSAFFATLAISQTAQRKTACPSWRRVGKPPSRSAKASWRVLFMPTASHLDPSEPHWVGPIPTISLGPTTAAPAPSPSRKEILRSVGSTMSLSFSAPTTKT